jgi:hypothetical protein
MFDDYCDPEVTARNIEAASGLPIFDPLVARSYYSANMRQSALILLYGASSLNAVGLRSASVAILAHRFHLSRPLLCHLAWWLALDHLCERVSAYVRASDWHTQNVLRRLGFQFERRAAGHFRSGEDASVWTLETLGTRAVELLFERSTVSILPAPRWTFNPTPAARLDLGV